MSLHKVCSVTIIFGLALGAPGETVIDDHFDDGEVTGWKSLGNTLLADHNISEEDSAITSEVVGTEANLNTNRGLVSEASFNPLADASGFTMTFEILSQDGGEPGANGLFLGLTSDDETFFRSEGIFSFGLVFYGFAPKTESQGGVSLITNDIGPGGPALNGLILDSNPDSIDLASFQDGCIATITADSTGWSFSVDEVTDFAGEPLTISKSGIWADANTDYASVFNGATDWFVLASNQGQPTNNIHTVVYDRIALATGGASGGDLEVTSIVPALSGEQPTVTLEWNSAPGVEYAVDVTADLTADNWAEVTDSVLSEGDTAQFVHELLPDFADLLAAGKAFYRIRRP
ncbi:MAG: hypothetical protein ABF382_07825 [Akkermansiaceae bacterium]